MSTREENTANGGNTPSIGLCGYQHYDSKALEAILDEHDIRTLIIALIGLEPGGSFIRPSDLPAVAQVKIKLLHLYLQAYCNTFNKDQEPADVIYCMLMHSWQDREIVPIWWVYKNLVTDFPGIFAGSHLIPTIEYAKGFKNYRFALESCIMANRMDEVFSALDESPLRKA